MTNFSYGRYLHHYETDADGVCHFSNYFRIFEEAFAATLRQSPGFSMESGHSFAVTEAQSVYSQPIRHGDYFKVNFSPTKVARSFLVASATIYVGDEVFAKVSGKLAAVGKSDNKSMPLNPELRVYFNELMER